MRGKARELRPPVPRKQVGLAFPAVIVGQCVQEESCQGMAMERFVEDYQKRRLTERVDIMTAINILMSQGYDEDDLIGEMTKVFYVDLDAFNDVIAHH
jgi:hypothetical protein